MGIVMGKEGVCEEKKKFLVWEFSGRSVIFILIRPSSIGTKWCR